MKHFITATLFTFFALYPAICLPTEYLITMHNGGKMTVDGYWEEGDRLVLNIFGGSVVIEKSWVKSITKVEKKTPEPQTELTPHQLEKVQIKEQLLALYRQLNKDKKNGRPSRVEKRNRQIEKILFKLTELKKRAKRKNNGELPDWWEKFKVPSLNKKCFFRQICR